MNSKIYYLTPLITCVGIWYIWVTVNCYRSCDSLARIAELEHKVKALEQKPFRLTVVLPEESKLRKMKNENSLPGFANQFQANRN